MRQARQDDPNPLSFVTLEAPVTIVPDLAEVRHRATIIDRRSRGQERAEECGARDGAEEDGAWLCRLSPVTTAGMRDIAE